MPQTDVPAPSASSRWFDAAWLLAWGVFSSAWCLTASARHSATFDEPFYVEAGLESWRTGSNARLMRAGTMPLPVDVETLPLYVWEKFRGQPFDVNADFGRLLPVARAGNLLFWWLLLFYGWRVGRLFGGPWAGRLAVAFLACEPNLLAHASLATTDIAVTACLLALVYHFALGRGRGWWPRIGLPGLWYGIAVSAKASALLFGPLCLIAVELHRLWLEGHIAAQRAGTVRRWWAGTAELRRDLWRIVPLGLLFVFLYCGTDWKPQKSFVAWADKLPDGSVRDGLTWLSQNLCVFPNAGEGLVYQIKHNVRGHGVFILGEWERRAVWYYFPVALLIKLTVPTLCLLTLLLIVRRGALFSPPGAAAGLLLLFSLNCRVQIGIRLILPLVCLLMLTLAVAVVRAAPRRASAAAAALIGAALVPAVSAWPHGLTFMNGLWGGPEEGYRLLSDSNYDWGQGLYELEEWQRLHPERPTCVWYFGTDPRVKQPPFHLLQLHVMSLAKPEDLEPIVRGKFLAVGTTILHGNPKLSPSATQALSALRCREPVARTTTFIIYEFANAP